MSPVIDEARARVAPAVDAARTRLVEDVVPSVTAAVGTARETSAPARAEAKERATAAFLALTGKKPKARRWPTALLCLGAGALAGAAAATLGRARNTTPVPATTPFPATPPPPSQTTDQTSPMTGPGTSAGS